MRVVAMMQVALHRCAVCHTHPHVPREDALLPRTGDVKAFAVLTARCRSICYSFQVIVVKPPPQLWEDCTLQSRSWYTC